MLKFIARRLLLFIPMLLIITMVVFFLIQLPPGDYVTSELMRLEESGEDVSEEVRRALVKRYGLDLPLPVRYLKWLGNIVLHADFGRSMAWNRPVADLIGERLGLTFAVSFASLILTWIMAFPIAIYSATHQYSLFDYVFSFIAFLGRSVPGFLFALVLLWVGHSVLGLDIGGLFSMEYERAPWNWPKFWNLLQHLWVPVLVLGTSGTAGLIRILRANLLDELAKPYVVAARAKGLKESQLIWRYPVRVALNPFISSVGYVLPQLISGSAIVSVVLGLPTTGPVLLSALMVQDMYLAGSFLLMLSFMTILGTFLSDILLAWVDPRIRLGE